MRSKPHRRFQSEEAAPAGDPNRSATAWIGEAMRKVLTLVDQIADTDVPVLIQGESGVGKELVARALHERSSRAEHPFVKVNCAALPESLLESELFGFERGSFTGALNRRRGRFEVAGRGTIFLDEIAEMTAPLQAKLLHILQDRELTRLGGNQSLPIPARVLCATHQPLRERVRQGVFRRDLYYRIEGVCILIPPLRERRDEVRMFAEAFFARYKARYGHPELELSAQLYQSFEGYAFPGNVRELDNMMRRIAVLGSEASVLSEIAARSCTERKSLRDLLREAEQKALDVPLRDAVRCFIDEAERQAIAHVLALTDSNRTQSASLLGVSSRTLSRKIRRLGLGD